MKYNNHFTLRLTTGEIKEQDRLSASVPEFIADQMIYCALEPNQIVSIRRDSYRDGKTYTFEAKDEDSIKEVLDATISTLNEYEFWVNMAKKDIKAYLDKA